MDKKKVLSILLLIMVTFIVIIFAVTHPSTKANPPTESADQESTKETTTDSRPSVAEIIIDISTEVAEEDIAQFQGEWKDTESQYKKLLIAGSTVNDVFYGVIDTSGFKQFVDTFYFKYDENHQIVVCDEANQPKYILSIPEYGKLKMESVSASKQSSKLHLCHVFVYEPFPDFPPKGCQPRLLCCHLLTSHQRLFDTIFVLGF